MPTQKIQGTEAAPQTQAFIRAASRKVERLRRYRDRADQETTAGATALPASTSPTDDTFLAPDAALPPIEAFTAFVEALSCARYASPRLPAWWLSIAMRRSEGRCGYCETTLRPVPPPSVDAVIPIVAGGPHHPDAAVVCCKACRRAKGRKDLLLWKPDAPKLLRELRARLALEAWNHVTRDAADMQTEAKAASVIAERWRHPRFNCHAALIPHGGFIGWPDAAPVPTAVQLRLIFEHGAWRRHPSPKNAHRRHADAVVFWFPTQPGALDAIWDVIECNGLVRRVDLGHVVPPSEVGEAEPGQDWSMVLPTVVDLVRHQQRRQS